jgi:hypothetical protein
MSKQGFDLLYRVAWVVVAALAYHRALHGWSAHPKFDQWFWGCAIVVDLLLLGGTMAVAFGEAS